MFGHIFKYRLKCILRDKEMMFWTLLFPLVLATFFNMAFANLTSGEFFKTIPIAIIDNEGFQNENVKGMIKTVSEAESSNTKPLFKVDVVSQEDAKTMLYEDNISGYINFEDGLMGEVEITFKRSGMNQTIIKEVFDSFLQTNATATYIISNSTNQESVYANLSEFLFKQSSYFAKSEENLIFPDYTLIHFYSLIAMACFYGAFMGIKEVNSIQADISDEAIRINVAPVKKLKTFLTSLFAASIIQLTSILILLAYLIYVIKVDFSNQIGFVLILCVVATVCGVSYGTMIGALIKGSEGIKTAILVGTTMTLSFLAGMMQVEVKYLVTNAVPAMAFLNPVNVITDALYSLYYYPTYNRFFTNIAVICAFIIIFSSLTVWRLRRLKYASI